ncbi:related to protein SNF7 [Claviceps purpurea 20.1]|uniref:Related to protein SNF7 n=1 Tax=Claviceps purpurea (strain 20.1) TaxID=1111077 RepID=M1WFM7_CLAP2|nr:related to protein SNF7 [Claviceps purpurea 20.1]
MDDFIQQSPKSHSPPTFASLTWKAIEWAFGRLVCQAFQTQAARQATRFDRVFTKLHFRTSLANQLAAGTLLSEEDIEILLLSLSRDRCLIDYDGTIVRIRDPADKSTITQEDVAAASIKELIANVKHQIEILNNRLAQLHNEAKAALQNDNRAAARGALKSKKLAETSLCQRYSILNQVEDVAAKLEQASEQVQLVNIMHSSANALKSLNSRIGGSAQVEQLMEQIRVQMGETDEVAAILSDANAEHVDELELDDELAALKEGVREHEASTEAQEALLKLNELTGPPCKIYPDPELIAPTIERQVAHLSLEDSRGEHLKG